MKFCYNCKISHTFVNIILQTILYTVTYFDLSTIYIYNFFLYFEIAFILFLILIL